MRGGRDSAGFRVCSGFERSLMIMCYRALMIRTGFWGVFMVYLYNRDQKGIR